MAPFEPYPDQMTRVAEVVNRLDNQFSFSQGTYEPDGADRKIFEAAVKSEFSKLGITVGVSWEHRPRFDGSPSGVYSPHIEMQFYDESETDHDRVQWGVVRGLADGKPGYVREDGTWREDPIKRNIV